MGWNITEEGNVLHVAVDGRLVAAVAPANLNAGLLAESAAWADFAPAYRRLALSTLSWVLMAGYCLRSSPASCALTTFAERPAILTGGKRRVAPMGFPFESRFWTLMVSVSPLMFTRKRGAR